MKSLYNKTYIYIYAYTYLLEQKLTDNKDNFLLQLEQLKNRGEISEESYQTLEEAHYNFILDYQRSPKKHVKNVLKCILHRAILVCV